MSRHTDVPKDDYTPDQQALFDAITGGKRGSLRKPEDFVNAAGGLIGPFGVWMHAPRLGMIGQRLGEAIRFEGTLPDDWRELAILIVAHEWKTQYEWWAHARIGLDAGLDEAVIDAVKSGQPLPDGTSREMQAIYAVGRELIADRSLSDKGYEAAVAALGEPTVVELVMLFGYYHLISMTLNAFKVPLPPGEVRPFPDAPT